MKTLMLMINRGCIFILILLTVSIQLRGQALRDSLLVPEGSLTRFSIDLFYHHVISFHPVARQAAILTEVAQQEIRLARGNFDPKLEVQYLTKNYDGKDYYDILNGSLKFPTRLPIQPVLGLEQNSGQYLNHERYISDEFDYRQFYTGLSLALGRGLITDERRTALREAELFGGLIEAEQVKVINKLLLEAAKDYWEWCAAYYNYRLFNQSVEIASEIFRRMKMNYELGEVAQIDTIQAKITLQQRQVERQEALLNFQNTGIQLSNYLWDSLGNPLELSLAFVPVLPNDIIGITPSELEALKNLAKENHPELQKLRIKLQQLEVQRRLNAELIKPRLDVNYYLLNQPFDPEWNSSLLLNENYKFGLDFSFPIFVRKERAKLAQTKLKILNTQIESDFTQRQIINQIDAGYNDLVNSTAIIGQQSEMVNSYDRLLEAELINLENGESDLFKINIQQEKLIQAQSKLIKLLSSYEKQKAFLYWAAGTRTLEATP